MWKHQRRRFIASVRDLKHPNQTVTNENESRPDPNAPAIGDGDGENEKELSNEWPYQKSNYKYILRWSAGHGKRFPKILLTLCVRV